MMMPLTLPFSNATTSRDAAVAIAPTAAGLRKLVAETVANHPQGLTCDELEVILNLRHQTCSARVHELVKSGHLVDSGATRSTRSARGTQAIVWVSGSVETVAVAAAAIPPSVMKVRATPADLLSLLAVVAGTGNQDPAVARAFTAIKKACLKGKGR